jgi:L-iditol 2-dehydrogenase
VSDEGSPHSIFVLSELTDCRLPDSLSYEEGALSEPLAVAVHACRRAQIRQGSSCTIMGAGAIGLLCALTARFEGCEHTAIVDIAAERVQFALDNRFADVGYVVESGRARDADDNLRIAKVISTCVEELIRPDGQMMGKTDYRFECTGMSTCLQASIYVGLPQLSGFVGSHHGRQN